MLKFALMLPFALLPIVGHAHDLRPSNRWCRIGKPVVMGLEGKAMRTFDEATFPGVVNQHCKRLGAPSTGTGPTTPQHSGGDCGLFDDYAKALETAKEYCIDNYLDGVTSDDYGDVIVQVLAPDTFFAPDHHDAYTLDQGIQFVCMRCEPATGTPAPSNPPAPTAPGN